MEGCEVDFVCGATAVGFGVCVSVAAPAKDVVGRETEVDSGADARDVEVGRFAVVLVIVPVTTGFLTWVILK